MRWSAVCSGRNAPCFRCWPNVSSKNLLSKHGVEFVSSHTGLQHQGMVGSGAEEFGDGVRRHDHQLGCLGRDVPVGPGEPRPCASSDVVPEVASLLGISRASAYRYADAGLLPGIRRLGRRVYVVRARLVEFLEPDHDGAAEVEAA